jgi:hypothetical protein
MPLETIEAYERLGEHLSALDAVIDAFAVAHGYSVTRRGRYPNRYLTQHGILMRGIEISMGDDERGQRFDQFFPEIPYIIWGGAWVDDLSARKRYCSPHLRTYPLPFSTLKRILPRYLDHFHSYLSAVTEEFIRSCGTVSELVPGPQIRDLPVPPPADEP